MRSKAEEHAAERANRGPQLSNGSLLVIHVLMLFLVRGIMSYGRFGYTLSSEV